MCVCGEGRREGEGELKEEGDKGEMNWLRRSRKVRISCKEEHTSTEDKKGRDIYEKV